MDKAAERSRTTPEGPWPAPERVERLLDGARAAPGAAGESRLAELLRALTAAAAADRVDPVRERAALSAFRTARGPRGADARPVRRTGRGFAQPAWPARALAGGLAAVCALGVVTIAAGAGALPGPFRAGGVQHAGPSAPVTGERSPSPGPDRTHESAPDGGRGPRTPLSGAPAPSVPSGAPDPRALCQRYAHALLPGGRPDAALTDRLRRVAGGRDRVTAYCRRFQGGHPAPTAGSRVGPGKDRGTDRKAERNTDGTAKANTDPKSERVPGREPERGGANRDVPRRDTAKGRAEGRADADRPAAAADPPDRSGTPVPDRSPACRRGCETTWEPPGGSPGRGGDPAE
ncbi:hypothetical protein ACFO3J_07825 [Streptomyces polygonati]|uniref:Uncharacterized protein n=1 Tax=Streptomyces polygonati TaxID=1617087 RepID=A0ABV8HH18_9ACTN